MKKQLFVVTVGLGLLSPIILHAQNQNQKKDTVLTSLGLDRLSAKFTIAGSMSGLGTSANPLGGNVAWPQSDASCVSWNPAALGFLAGRSVIADWVPAVQPDLNKLAKFDQKVNDQMDSVLIKNGHSDHQVYYPTTFAKAGFQSSLTGFALAVPFQAGGMHFGVGFAYVTPFMLNLQLSGSGLEAGIATTDTLAGNLTNIGMRARASLNGNIEFKIGQLIVGAGCDFGQGWAAGFALNRYQMRLIAGGMVTTDAIISLNGTEYAFNDRNDPKIDFTHGESNSLDQSFSMRYSASGWGYKLGVTKRLASWANVGLVFSVPPSIHFSGSNNTLTHAFPAMKDSLNLTKLNLAKPTLTEEKNVINDWTPQIQLPRSTTLGVVLGTGMKLSLRVTFYSGEFSIGYKPNEIEGLRLKQGVGFGLDLKYFFIGASAMMGDEVFSLPAGAVQADYPLFKDRTPKPNIVVPNVNIGFRIPTLSNLWLDGLVGAQPTPVLRMTVRYTF